jgi:3-oxoacyl-[acyl-carrier protein] reductase
MNIHGKTIVVTGAARGIGQSIAVTLARGGANLALMDINRESMKRTVELCAEAGTAASAYEADVRDERIVEQTMDAIVTATGRLDGLVNNAGVIRDAKLIQVRDGKVTGGMSLEQWQTVIDVNLTGVLLCTRAAAAHMISLGAGGVIVNISSISRAGNAGQTNYSAAKAGVAAMATVWAQELGRYGIRAAALAPGFTRTEMLAAMKPEVLNKVIDPVPLRRLGEAEEIAAGVRFIFENDFISGRCLEIDGGLRL